MLIISSTACTGAIKFSGAPLLRGISSVPLGTTVDPVSDFLKIRGRCLSPFAVQADGDDVAQSEKTFCRADGTFDLQVLVSDKLEDKTRDIVIYQIDDQGFRQDSHFIVEQKYCDAHKTAADNPSGEGTETNPFHICASRQLNFFSATAVQTRSDYAHPDTNKEYVRLKVDLDLDDARLPSDYAAESRATVTFRNSGTYFNRYLDFDGEKHLLHSKRGRPLFHKFYAGAIRRLKIATDSTLYETPDNPYPDSSCLIGEVLSEQPYTPVGRNLVSLEDIDILKCDLQNAYAGLRNVDEVDVNPSNSNPFTVRGIGSLIGVIHTAGGAPTDIDIRHIGVGTVTLGADNSTDLTSMMGLVAGCAAFSGGGSFDLTDVKPLSQSASVQLLNVNTLARGAHTGGIVGSMGLAPSIQFPSAKGLAHFSVKDVASIPISVVSESWVGGIVGRLGFDYQLQNSSMTIENVSIDIGLELVRKTSVSAENMEIGGLVGYFESVSSVPASELVSLTIKNSFFKIRATYPDSSSLSRLGGLAGEFLRMGLVQVSQSAFDLELNPEFPGVNSSHLALNLAGGLAGDLFIPRDTNYSFSDSIFRLKVTTQNNLLGSMETELDSHEVSGVVGFYIEEGGGGAIGRMLFQNGYGVIDLNSKDSLGSYSHVLGTTSCNGCNDDTFDDFLYYQPQDFTRAPNATWFPDVYSVEDMYNLYNLTKDVWDFTSIWKAEAGVPNLRGSPWGYE